MTFPSVPRLPTDNLYKFVALAGLLLFIVGWVGPAIALSRAGDRSFALKREVALVELERQSDSLGIELLQTEEQHDTSARHVRRVDSLRVRTDSTRRHLISVQAEQEALEDALWWLQVYRVLGALLTIGGGIASVWGFWHWYHRLQKPLDEWVKKHGNSPDAPE